MQGRRAVIRLPALGLFGLLERLYLSRASRAAAGRADRPVLEGARSGQHRAGRSRRLGSLPRDLRLDRCRRHQSGCLRQGDPSRPGGAWRLSRAPRRDPGRAARPTRAAGLLGQPVQRPHGRAGARALPGDLDPRRPLRSVRHRPLVRAAARGARSKAQPERHRARHPAPHLAGPAHPLPPELRRPRLSEPRRASVPRGDHRAEHGGRGAHLHQRSARRAFRFRWRADRLQDLRLVRGRLRRLGRRACSPIFAATPTRS